MDRYHYGNDLICVWCHKALNLFCPESHIIDLKCMKTLTSNKAQKLGIMRKVLKFMPSRLLKMAVLDLNL